MQQNNFSLSDSFSHVNRIGGSLAGVLLWFLWLRRGRLRSVTSELRRYDRSIKSRKQSKIPWKLVVSFFLGLAGAGLIIYQIQKSKRKENGQTKDHQEDSASSGVSAAKEGEGVEKDMEAESPKMVKEDEQTPLEPQSSDPKEHDNPPAESEQQGKETLNPQRDDSNEHEQSSPLDTRRDADEG